MTPATRAFDVAFALVLAALIAVPFLVVFAIHMLAMGRPYFYPTERMRGPQRPFVLWKLRSMRPDRDDTGVSGGDKAARVPRWGRFLRASRLDEVPQLWNILRGDMRLVGPRPPLRQYVERFSGLYAQVLQRPPGITGLGTLAFHRHERRLLADCVTASETDEVYTRRCVPRKACLDLIYHRRQGLVLDALILIWTVQTLALRRRQRLWRVRPAVAMQRRGKAVEPVPGLTA